MRITANLLLMLALGLAACSNSLPSSLDTSSLQGLWASDELSLTARDQDAYLELLASGGCFGSYAEIPQAIPKDAFSIPGTYTQLMGAFPGKRDYPAQFTGQLDGRDLVLSISVPTLSLMIGPIHLTAGRKQTWSACRYP